MTAAGRSALIEALAKLLLADLERRPPERPEIPKPGPAPREGPVRPAR
jgi:hypothetical protein